MMAILLAGTAHDVAPWHASHMDRFAALQTFVATFESGSFSAAARRLDMGQPAISKTIAQLEAHLGTRLFARTTHGLSATEAARAFYVHAKEALAQLDEGEQAARAEGDGISGLLRVTAPVTFSRMQIVPHLGRFFDAHPALRLDLVQDDRPVDLLREGVDLALRIGPQPDSTMTARRLARTTRVLVASRRFVERHGEPAAPTDLHRFPFVLYTHGGVARDLRLRRNDEDVAVAMSGPLCVSSAEGLRAAVLAGLGLAVTSRWVFRDELAAGDVVALLPGWSLGHVDLFAVYPTGAQPGAKARAFATFVEALMATDAHEAHAAAD